jgi:hypothetical protein
VRDTAQQQAYCHQQQPPQVECHPLTFLRHTRRPRRQAHVPVYQKTNARLLDPATGQRRRYGKRAGPAAPKPFMSFTTFALTAFVGYKAVQTLWRMVRGRRQQQQQQEHLLDVSEEEEEGHWQQQQQHQQLRGLPSTQQQPSGPSAFLRRALPTLGPPRRAKQLAAQHRQQRAAAAAAVQRAATGGGGRGGRAGGRQRLTQPVHERRKGMLEKWETVLKQQQVGACVLVCGVCVAVQHAANC